MKIRNDQVAIQCCQKHWKMMEQAIADRGMDHLISKNQKEAEKCFNESDGEPWKMTDPLLQAFTMMGAQLMVNGIPEGKIDEFAGKEVCPVCTAINLTKDTAVTTETHWTGGLADFILSEYRERGLLPRLQ